MAAGNFFGGQFFGGGFFGAISTASTTPGGVSKRVRKREVIVNLKDVQNREDTAEFLKSQLRLRHPESAFVDTSAQEAEKARRALAKQARREKAMRLQAEKDAARFALEAAQLEEQQKRLIKIQNENTLIMLMIGASV